MSIVGCLLGFLFSGCSLFSEAKKDPCLYLQKEQCFDCLVEKNTEGYDLYHRSIVDNCYCGFECEVECENYCIEEPFEPDASCSSCFDAVSQDSQSICISNFLNQCEEQEQCMELVLLLQECGTEND